MTIESNQYNRVLIDVKAHGIVDYKEVMETNIVSKVVVLTDTNTYYLYLLNDRTTTTDATNPNRALGRTETIFTENYDEAHHIFENISDYKDSVEYLRDIPYQKAVLSTQEGLFLGSRYVRERKRAEKGDCEIPLWLD